MNNHLTEAGQFRSDKYANFGGDPSRPYTPPGYIALKTADPAAWIPLLTYAVRTHDYDLQNDLAMAVLLDISATVKKGTVQHWLSPTTGPDETIGPPDDPYLHRWHVIHRAPGVGNVYFHIFHRSDSDRHLHDHPWDSIAVILKGAYREIREDGDTGEYFEEFRAGDVVMRTAECAHRIEILEPTWTLFVTARKRREWGFHTPQGFVHWKDYLGIGEGETAE